ncbi:MAG: hypothetical protein ACI3YI_12490 [Bacteroidaceae bacterium]
MTRIEQMTMDAIQSMNRKMIDQHDIDWEQRRYEIAKEMMPYCLKSIIEALNSGHGNDEWVGKTIAQIVSESAVGFADALIERLKGKEQ